MLKVVEKLDTDRHDIAERELAACNYEVLRPAFSKRVPMLSELLGWTPRPSGHQALADLGGVSVIAEPQSDTSSNELLAIESNFIHNACA